MKQISETEYRELENSYLNANYVAAIPSGRIVIRIGKTNSELDALLRRHNAENWAFVSAYNPFSRPVSENENMRQHANLIDRLKRENVVFYEGSGESPTGDWEPETSLLILNIARKAAIELGKELEQNAIVAGEIEGPPELVWCVSLENN